MSALPLRVHVVSDQTGATQEIAFGAAMRGLLDLSFADARKGRDRLPQLLPPDLQADRPAALVLSRLTAPALPELLRWARARGVPSLYHLDDDLLDVPAEVGAERAARYGEPDRWLRLREALDAADLVYASTPALAERLRAHGVEAPVHGGAIFSSVEPGDMRDAPPATLPAMGYMGSDSHAADLAAILPAVERLLDARPLLQFEVMGSLPLPEGLARFGPRVRRHEAVRDYRGFRRRLAGLGWWVGLAPLLDLPFNRCKTDTKWVEYSAAGIAVVAQEGPVYGPACAGGAGRLASGPEAWEREVGALLDDPAARSEAVARARARLLAERTHSRLRLQVLEVLAAAQEAANRRGRARA